MIAVGQQAERVGDLVRGDIVDVGGGRRFVITRPKPQGQRYLWAAVNENGHSGAEYKMARGVRKVGHDANHPALMNVRSERNGGLDPSQKIVIGRMCDAIDRNDLMQAKVLAATVRDLLV